MEIQRPPRPQEIDITAEMARNITNEAEEKLFQKDKESLYGAILSKAMEGSYYLEYRFNANVKRSDILKLQNELVSKGFEVELSCGYYDELKIKWYPKD